MGGNGCKYYRPAAIVWVLCVLGMLPDIPGTHTARSQRVGDARRARRKNSVQLDSSCISIISSQSLQCRMVDRRVHASRASSIHAEAPCACYI